MDSDSDGRRDFDFFFGRWRIRNQRLRERLADCTEWQEFEFVTECRPILGGMANIDNLDAEPFPDGKPLHGATLRIFNPKTRLWSLYWIDDRNCEIQPPVVGRFQNGRGEFVGDDTFKGKPIRVRFIWSDVTPDSAHWEQAFSADEGQTWETNWRSVMTRLG